MPGLTRLNNAINILIQKPLFAIGFALRWVDVPDRVLAYLMILPAAILILLFAIYPAIQGLMVSFNRVDFATLEMSYSGLDNYRELLKEDLFLDSLRRTVVLVTISTIIQLLLGLAISLLLHQSLIGRGLARGLVLFPYLIPAIAIALTWRFMLDPNPRLGIVNRELIEYGILERPYAFLTRPNSALYVVIFAGIWKYTPFFVIMLLARLQVIPLEIEEAAKLDGANSWQVFYYIILPWLMPVVIVALLLRTIWTFNEFEMVYLFARGGPREATTTLPVLVNRFVKTDQDLGMAAATATIMVVILFALSLVYFKLYDRAEQTLY